MRYGLLGLSAFLALLWTAVPSAQANVSSTLATTASPEVVVEPSLPLTSTTTQSQTSSLVLQMADGRFYHPATGRIGATRDEVLASQATTTLVGSSSSTMVELATTTLPLFPLRAAIEEGRALLRTEMGTSSLRSVTSLMQKVMLTFAVWDPSASSTSSLETVSSSTSVIQLIEKAVSLQDLQKKGIRTMMTSLEKDGVVVAVYYPLITETGTKKNKRYDMRWVVYTPYTGSLHTDGMVALGKARLRRLTQDIYLELRQQGVMSRAFPDRLIVDAFDEALPQAIAAIEHSDYLSLKKKGEEGLEPFYVLLAANPDNAFGYALSPAGARGLAQFMPKTYESLVKHRSDVKLVRTFSEAMERPADSLKAGILYLDLLLRELPVQARERYVAEEGQVNEFIVAAYNGGPARVSRAVADWDAHIVSGTERMVELQKKSTQASTTIRTLKKQLTATTDVEEKTEVQATIKLKEKALALLQQQLKTLEKSLLRDETIEYIMKYRQVVGWFREPVPPLLVTATSSTPPLIHSADVIEASL